MMTRQDFIKFAVVIHDQVDKMERVGLDSGERELVLEFLADVASDIADVCDSSNGQFDREKFLSACGL